MRVDTKCVSLFCVAATIAGLVLVVHILGLRLSVHKPDRPMSGQGLNSHKHDMSMLSISKLQVTHISDQDQVNSHKLSSSERPFKKFAYLTQTESCLYDYLRSPQQLGDSTSCQCDVLVLSYKQKCNDASLPHVEYIFDPNTTWTPGRNLLYRSIMKREQKYLLLHFLR